MGGGKLRNDDTPEWQRLGRVLKLLTTFCLEKQDASMPNQGFIQDFLLGGGNVFSHASTKHVNVGGGLEASPPRKMFSNLASLRLILV